ncbi:MAG: sensor histidine kinase [Nocardioidaceae bacterium]
MRPPARRLTLRARLLLIGVLGVAIALAIGSVALYAVLSYVSYRTLDDGGAATAADVAMLVRQGQLPDPIPVTGSQIVQVVDARDRVLAASVNADRLTALLLAGEVHRAAAAPIEVPGSRVGLASRLRVVALPVGHGQARTVVVAQEVGEIVHSQRVLRRTLLVTYPLLLGVLALIAWRVVGAALRPVEALRSSAESISGTGQDARLPVPASGDEIHALAVTLNSMLDRLRTARARQRGFIADAAHELRSPLASMRTQLEVAQHLGEDTPLTEDLRLEVERMAALVEDLLVLARLDADTAPPAATEPVEVGSLVREVAGRYDAARVPVTVTSGPSCDVQGNREDLRRALSNLLDNAVRHAASAVELSSVVNGPHVLVAVSDDGAGIAGVDRERVFERFTRLDDARDRDAGGSGLGLAIVRELVRRGGGDVRLTDSPSGGLCAQLVLPRAGSQH